MRTRTVSGIIPLLLAFAAGVASAPALTPGPTIIHECPQCKKPLRQFTIGTGNTFGAQWWTDGKMIAPGLPQWSGLGKCPHCQELFWIVEAKQLGELDGFRRSGSPEDSSAWKEALEIATPTEADHLVAAEAKGLSRERELEARRWAWWAANDAIRTNPGPRYIWSGPRRKNLERLLELLDSTIAHEVIAKAEIARELGQFELCVKLLERRFDKPGQASFAEFVRKLASQKQSNVQLLPALEDKKAP